jgi:hypothetical protein
MLWPDRVKAELCLKDVSFSNWLWGDLPILGGRRSSPVLAGI